MYAYLLILICSCTAKNDYSYSQYQIDDKQNQGSLEIIALFGLVFEPNAHTNVITILTSGIIKIKFVINHSLTLTIGAC